MKGGDVLEELEQLGGRDVTPLSPSADGVLATPSSSLARSYARVEDVLCDVLDQFARNFLLNDLTAPESQKLLERTSASLSTRFTLPRREPRRRATTIEQVHQARVSIRRLRSTLRTFGATFAPHWVSPLATELSWYASALGEVRDLDVLRDSIAKTLWLVDDNRIRTLVSGRLNRLSEAAHDRLALEKSTKRYACLVDDIATIANAKFANGIPENAKEALRPGVERAWAQVTKYRRQAKIDPSTERLHRVRIELKRLQCACEIVGLVDPEHSLKVARASASAQSHLGAVHDEAGASAWLRGLVVAEPRLKRPLRAIIAAHEDERKEAQVGWLDELAKVERRWDRWDL